MSNVRIWEPELGQPFVLAGRRVDPAAQIIVSANSTVEVEPRVMAVLIALAQRQGGTVRRQELIDRVWNGAPGADQSLNNAISLLRRALEDTNADRRLIQTIPKQGYRLCAPVEPEADAAAPPPAAERNIKPAQSLKVRAHAGRWRGAVLASILAVLVTAAGAIAFFQRQPTNETANADNSAELDPNTIAVLPFVNMSAEPDNVYFSDGLAEEILHALSQIDTLSVASRTDSFQYRDSKASVTEIAQRLRVANILEGSVRREGDRLRVTAQLISASSGAHLWSSTYDRDAEDILAIQQDIAVNIAGALVEKISETERNLLTTLPTENFEAYEQYLIGKHELRKWTPEGNRRSIDFFQQAVALDPEFAEARLAMGRAYYFAGTHYGWMTPAEAIPKVKASLVYGVSATNPVTRASALSVYGDVLAWNDRDWPGALAAYERAFELSGTPPLGYALTNSIVGNHDVAIRILKKLLEDGAGDIGINGDIGIRNNLAWAYFNARRYDDAMREASDVLSEDPAFADGYRVLGRAQLMLGKADEAIESFSNAARLTGGAAIAKSDLAVALARAGRKEEARAILEDLLNRGDYVPAPLIAQIHANLGEHDEAFIWLEKGVGDRSRGVIFLKINPFYDPIRDDARFSGLLLQLNLNS
ncbi:tetratricopeptide repeat protein [Hyphococcus sp.]|uniref:tetratricopeptide repeat protein n=1 Tax=Hyphococcus sp. TaxID=2038636 RepID=UPI0035C70D1B